MAEYHIGCGLSAIYAGTLKKTNEWLNKSDVTDEAVRAVANWLYFKIEEGQNSFGYAWKTKNGKTVSLICSVDEQKDENIE